MRLRLRIYSDFWKMDNLCQFIVKYIMNYKESKKDHI